MTKLIITRKRLTPPVSKRFAPHWRKAATTVLAIGLVLSAPGAMACKPVADTADSTVNTYLWSLNIPAGDSELPGSCTTAMNGVVASMNQKPQLKIEILTYSDAYGSSSMALAQLSKLSKQLTATLLQAAQKVKIKVIATYGLDSDTGNDTTKPPTGRIVLRLINKN